MSRSQNYIDLYYSFKEGRLSLSQFRAQMKDLGFDDDEIDIYIDGDTELSEDQLRFH